MKILFASLFALAFLSCDSPSFKVGECVQKPDSMIVWKVEEVSEDEIVLSQNQNPQMEESKTTSASKGWIKTECL